MSLLLWKDPFEILRRSDLLVPPEVHNWLRCPEDFVCPYRSLIPQDTGATVNFDKDKFQANIDVQQFRPDEISVKVSNNTVTVEGKHEERQDEHGFVSRHFVRKYVLPKGHDVNQVESKLSSDGVLTISAPKINSEEGAARNIPITQTGKPTKAVENKSSKKEE